jgi:hypothetical protein
MMWRSGDESLPMANNWSIVWQGCFSTFVAFLFINWMESIGRIEEPKVN